MELQSIAQAAQEQKHKKILIIVIIALLSLLFVGGGTYVLTGGFGSWGASKNQESATNAQVLADLEKLAPRSNYATSTSLLLPKIVLTSDNEEVAPGQAVKVSWSADNATSCVNIEGESLATKGEATFVPMEDYTFDILCTGPNGTNLESITIPVTSGPIITMKANPPVAKSGERATISWEAKNADRCVDEKGNTVRLRDSVAFVVKAPYTINISCTNSNGTAKKSLTVALDTTKPTVASKPAPKSFFSNITNKFTWKALEGTVDTQTTPEAAIEVTLTGPEKINYNESATLSWVVKNATYCVFTTDKTLNGIPPFTYTSGSRATSKLKESQTFTISCSKGSQKVDKTITIAVGSAPEAGAPVITRFEISPDYAATFDSVKARWETTNVKSCTIKKDGVDYKTFLPARNTAGYALYENKEGNFTYKLVCKGEGGEVSSEDQQVEVIACRFKNGFGGNPEEVINGKVERYAKSGHPLNGRVICTHTFGTPFSSGEISGIWGFARELRWVDPASGVRTNDERELCKYTLYSTRTSGGSVISGSWFDTSYHSNWEYLTSNKWTHGTSCGGGYGLTFWNPPVPEHQETTCSGDPGSESCYTYTVPASGGNFSWADIWPCGAPVPIVSSLTCVIPPSDKVEALRAYNLSNLGK